MNINNIVELREHYPDIVKTFAYQVRILNRNIERSKRILAKTAKKGIIKLGTLVKR